MFYSGRRRRSISDWGAFLAASALTLVGAACSGVARFLLLIATCLPFLSWLSCFRYASQLRATAVKAYQSEPQCVSHVRVFLISAFHYARPLLAGCALVVGCEISFFVLASITVIPESVWKPRVQDILRINWVANAYLIVTVLCIECGMLLFIAADGPLLWAYFSSLGDDCDYDFQKCVETAESQARSVAAGSLVPLAQTALAEHKLDKLKRDYVRRGFAIFLACLLLTGACFAGLIHIYTLLSHTALIADGEEGVLCNGACWSDMIDLGYLLTVSFATIGYGDLHFTGPAGRLIGGALAVLVAGNALFLVTWYHNYSLTFRDRLKRGIDLLTGQ